MDVPDLDTVTVELDGAVGHLWLDRPDKLNPLSTATLEELVVAARWFDARPGARVVVVGGRGRAFSAGARVGSFRGTTQGAPRGGGGTAPGAGGSPSGL